MNIFASKFISGTGPWAKTLLVSLFWVSELSGNIFCVIKRSFYLARARLALHSFPEKKNFLMKLFWTGVINQYKWWNQHLGLILASPCQGTFLGISDDIFLREKRAEVNYLQKRSRLCSLALLSRSFWGKPKCAALLEPFLTPDSIYLLDPLALRTWILIFPSALPVH